MLAGGQSSSAILMAVPMGRYSENRIGYTPYESVRIQKQGGGRNFVHGGVSLQECCVPVITFKNISKSSKNLWRSRKHGSN